MAVKEKDVVGGRYEVMRKLGEGGMSIVWLAFDNKVKRQVAIKEVKQNSNDGLYQANIEGTRQEANIMKGLDHPALPRIYDVFDDGEGLLVVMDFIPGEDLLKRLKERGRAFAESDVVEWGIQLCDALGYMHKQNIIYRDMKPGNVILQEDGTVKIIDFGIAREYKEGQALDTTPLGTRGYAPPEAFVAGERSQTDARSDVYTLGVTLFHLITGHSPREYVTQPNLPPIRSIDPQLSPAVEMIIIKATHWDREKRQQSMAELRYELENLQPPEYYVKLRRRMNIFRGLVIAASVFLIAGIGTRIASTQVRAQSFDGLVQRASLASTEQEGEEPSEAERLYMEAIEVLPTDIRPYEALVNDVYKADEKFTYEEATRWSRVFEDNLGSIQGSNRFARLCFDAGIDYFTFYDYGDEMTRGQQAVSWFTRAINDYDARVARGETPKPVGGRDTDGDFTMTEQDRRTAEIYVTIGEFSQRIKIAIAEGRESETYAQYWDALEQAVANAGEGETIVQLRLYSVVFRAINSPTYLSGFYRAGISQDRVTSLLEEVYRKTGALAQPASSSETTADLYNEVITNYPNAVNNIESTFGSVGARRSEQPTATATTGEANS